MIPAAGKLAEHLANLRTEDQARDDVLGDYYDRLNRFDWDFEYTDDGEVWETALETRRLLRKEAETSPYHAALFRLFEKHGGAWQTVEKHRPPNTPEMPTRPGSERRAA